MPYIKNENNRRSMLRLGSTAQSAGELNYQIFSYVKNVEIDVNESDWCRWRIKDFVLDFLGSKPNYQKYNDMVGCLLLCKKEIKRRLSIDVKYLEELIDSFDDEIAKYEDLKIKENGDV